MHATDVAFCCATSISVHEFPIENFRLPPEYVEGREIRMCAIAPSFDGFL